MLGSATARIEAQTLCAGCSVVDVDVDVEVRQGEGGGLTCTDERESAGAESLRELQGLTPEIYTPPEPSSCRVLPAPVLSCPNVWSDVEPGRDSSRFRRINGEVRAQRVGRSVTTDVTPVLHSA